MLKEYLWNMFEESGEINIYLFYKTLASNNKEQGDEDSESDDRMLNIN